MSGKEKPLKAPKKDPKVLDEDDLALKEKLKAEKAALAALAGQIKTKGGPLSQGGIKKSK
jgi:hypothetical protein